jgi:acetyl-CoA carboxylase carboxyltransferase component
VSWQPEVDEIERRRAMAREMGGAEAVARQHAKGRLSVRERLDALLDEDSFREIGTLFGRAEYGDDGELSEFTHVSRVIGTGSIDGRQVAVDAGDFTIRGGWADPTSFVGAGRFSIEQLAVDRRIPYIRLIDSAGGSVESIRVKGRTVLLGGPHLYGPWHALMAHVPVVSAALGSLGGEPPVRVAAAHWSVMTRHTSELFVAGPPLVKQAFHRDITKQELGGWKVHACQSGVVDNVADDELAAFDLIKRFLSYLPQNVWQQPPRVDMADSPARRDDELLSIIPRDRRKAYSIRDIIERVVDRGSTFELAPLYAPSVVTMLARLDGYPVAVMSNDCRVLGGAQTAAGCEKMMRFIDLADTFHLPVVYLVDCPGFMIGPDSEREGIERKSARLAFAMAQMTVPAQAIILRRSFGVAGAMHGSLSRLNLRYAWPSGDWGSLPIEGGVMAAYRREIEASADPERTRAELEQQFEPFRSPFRTAEAFDVEEIIDPRETRPILCDFVKNAQEITRTQLGPKWRLGIRP